MYMHNRLRGFLLLLFLLSGLLSISQGQTITQPIVFTEGWVTGFGTPEKYPRYARTEFPVDPVISRLLSGKSIRPEGSQDSPSLDWEPIEADAEGYFKHKYLASGGLYLEYESPSDRVVILDASGHGKAYVNGVPREGDHFGFGITKVPVQLTKGRNTFYLTSGRNPEIRAALRAVESPVQLSDDQLTLPDLIQEETGFKWAGIKVINAAETAATDYRILARVEGGEEMSTALPVIEKLTSRIVPFRIPELEGVLRSEAVVQLRLLSASGQELGSLTLPLKNRSAGGLHNRTFISSIDGSVQYYAVQPGQVPEGQAPALFFSTHGAGVEASGQAAVYTSKDWGHLIAPTNRGPFGFAWEDWGRLDALEVLEIGKKRFQPDPQKIYLTGHSMGGHASWYLGASYPDYWAAIGPAAGYAELHDWIEHVRKVETPIQRMFARAGNAQRTRLLHRNYLHFGVYINHGDADAVVPVRHAREMRQLLAGFHPDFSYYEYPGGGHWYGNHSADWPPMFDFFKSHQLPLPAQVRKLQFQTASPGISSRSHWVTLYQQTHPYQISEVDLALGADSLSLQGTTQNVTVLQLDLSKAAVLFPLLIALDESQLRLERAVKEITLVRTDTGEWEVGTLPGRDEKGPHRYGGFKDAFRHRMIFVYGTQGSPEENAWNFYKARFDAETFGYRGNGAIELLPDRQFSPEAYPDRGVILYGNADTNNAWKQLLAESPVQVRRGEMKLGERVWTGEGWGCYFIQPRPDSDIASVGVVAGTGPAGFAAVHANHYFLAGTAFPDLTIVGADVFETGYGAVVGTGYFGNDWGVETGDFVWKENR